MVCHYFLRSPDHMRVQLAVLLKNSIVYHEMYVSGYMKLIRQAEIRICWGRFPYIPSSFQSGSIWIRTHKVVPRKL